jgi:hypothetical protein
MSSAWNKSFCPATKLFGKESGPIVAAHDAKIATSKAIAQFLADKAPNSLCRVEIVPKEIRPAIESTGVMDKRGLAALDKQIDEIRRTVDPTRREQLIRRGCIVRCDMD